MEWVGKIRKETFQHLKGDKEMAGSKTKSIRNEDRRVVRTKSRLKQSLNKLMEQKSMMEISVQELTEMADINRSTFYLHYKDIYDIIETTENEILEDLNKILDSKFDEENATPLPVLEEIFKLLMDNSRMCMSLLGPNGDVAFTNKLVALIRERCLQDFMSYYGQINAKNFEYYYSFIVSGCVGMSKKWMANGMIETPEQMAALTGQMILFGVKVLYPENKEKEKKAM